MTGGDIFGSVYENELVTQHKMMVPPSVYGKVVKVYGDAADGKDQYSITDTVLEVYNEQTRKTHELKLAHYWPVRRARPIVQKMPGNHALTTGLRVVDAIFPSVLGGLVLYLARSAAARPSFQSISKFSNSDAVIYVGCGERGNEMAEVLCDFPELTTTIDGKEVGIMKRTALVANTSNMPVAAREASIYTGITLAEYPGHGHEREHDGRFHLALGRGAPRDTGRLGEMPADSGYPAYLGARLAAFYERAGGRNV